MVSVFLTFISNSVSGSDCSTTYFTCSTPQASVIGVSSTEVDTAGTGVATTGMTEDEDSAIKSRGLEVTAMIEGPDTIGVEIIAYWTSATCSDFDNHLLLSHPHEPLL